MVMALGSALCPACAPQPPVPLHPPPTLTVMSAAAASPVKEVPKYSKGLAGVIAGESAISTVGKEGERAS